MACKAFDWKTLKNFLAVNDLEGFVAVTEHDEACFGGRPRIEDAGRKEDDSLDEVIICRVPNYFIKVFANCFMKKSADCTTYRTKPMNKSSGG